MVQTGDPTNSGKGGNSIWGGKFNDEIIDDLKHKTRGVFPWQIQVQTLTDLSFL